MDNDDDHSTKGDREAVDRILELIRDAVPPTRHRPTTREAVDRLVELIRGLDCDPVADVEIGIDLLRTVMDRFGFVGAVICAGDVRKVWEQLDAEEGETVPFDFDAVRATYWWRHNLASDAVMEDVWDLVRDMASDAREAVRARS
jgi:hypothetical protein